MASTSMLLVMDMINDLVHEDGPSAYKHELARRETLGRTAALIDNARSRRIRIGYVRIGFSPGYLECPPNSPIFSGARKAGMFQLGEWGTEVHPLLAPRPEDADIVKHRVSPFYGTRLEPLLRAHDIRRLYLCGISTIGVVASGTREGADRDYEIVVVEDCCCAISQVEHEAGMTSIKRFGRFAQSKELEFDA